MFLVRKLKENKSWQVTATTPVFRFALDVQGAVAHISNTHLQENYRSMLKPVQPSRSGIFSTRQVLM